MQEHGGFKRHEPIERGYLQDDLDYVIYWVEGMAAFEKYDY